MRRSLPSLLLSAALAMALAACESGKAPGPGKAGAVGAAALAPAPLAETHWKPVELRGQPMPPLDDGREAVLILAGNGQVSGAAGCNRMFGPWKAEGADGLRIGPLATTRMGCLATPEVEQRFLAALADARRQRHAGQSLELIDAAGTVIARFQALARR